MVICITSRKDFLITLSMSKVVSEYSHTSCSTSIFMIALLYQLLCFFFMCCRDLSLWYVVLDQNSTKKKLDQSSRQFLFAVLGGKERLLMNFVP